MLEYFLFSQIFDQELLSKIFLFQIWNFTGKHVLIIDMVGIVFEFQISCDHIYWSVAWHVWFSVQDNWLQLKSHLIEISF